MLDDIFGYVWAYFGWELDLYSYSFLSIFKSILMCFLMVEWWWIRYYVAKLSCGKKYDR